MKTNLKTNITVKEICDGFVYNELEGKGLLACLVSSPFSRSIKEIISMLLTVAKEKWLLLNQCLKDTL